MLALTLATLSLASIAVSLPAVAEKVAPHSRIQLTTYDLNSSSGAVRRLTGYIKLNGSFSGDLGYIYNDINTYTGFLTVATTNVSLAQIVTLPEATCGALQAPFEILAPTPNATKFPYLGMSTLSQNASILDRNVNSTRGNYAVLLGTKSSPQGSLSGKKNNSLSSAPYRGSEYVGGQSSIWSLNCSTLSFTPTWINSDGANDAIQAFYTSTFTGDNGKPSGTGYYGAFNYANAEAGYFTPPIKNLVYGPNGDGQIVIVSEILTLTFVPLP